MARYHQTIQRYENIAPKLFELIPQEHKEEALELIARLANAGVVCCPRGVQSTVRLTIVKGLLNDLPIRCTLRDTRINPESTTDFRTYNALVTQSLLTPEEGGLPTSKVKNN